MGGVLRIPEGTATTRAEDIEKAGQQEPLNRVHHVVNVSQGEEEGGASREEDCTTDEESFPLPITKQLALPHDRVETVQISRQPVWEEVKAAVVKFRVQQLEGVPRKESVDAGATE